MIIYVFLIHYLLYQNLIAIVFMFFSTLIVLHAYLSLRNKNLCAICLLSAAGASATGASAAAVPLFPAELGTLVTAAIRNHPIAQSAQAKQRAALQDVPVAARFHWSARRLHRVLRVERTIADLANLDAITPAHLSEAVQYQRVLQV